MLYYIGLCSVNHPITRRIDRDQVDAARVLLALSEEERRELFALVAKTVKPVARMLGTRKKDQPEAKPEGWTDPNNIEALRSEAA